MKAALLDFADIYKHWKSAVQEAELLAELARIAENPSEIEERFYRELEFGTGGLRGVIGVGTNRMNIYTVAKATQGYSNYLKQIVPDPSVAIAYDSRILSVRFAKTAAEVFAANGIYVHIYPRLMPTPALSFAVRELNCSGGVVITASHNPAKYNGYKVYGKDGCQITTQIAKIIQQEIDKIDPFQDVQWTDFEEMLQKRQITYIGEETANQYIAAVSATSLLSKEFSRDLAITYTPLNGTGISCVPQCLEKNGFANLTIPKEQKDPDGNFPTCLYPNPEVKEALAVGLAHAKKMRSDLLLATDPDCDRVGAAVQGPGGSYTLINGNEMGVLLLDFICKMRTKNGTMPKDPIAVKTIVTTPMAEKVAKRYGVQLLDVLTGFKFIGEQIGFLEEKGEQERYIFGFEESYGYLSGSFVRDKDGVNASLLICEMVAWYRTEGRTLLDVLEQLHQTYGYYTSRLLSFSFEGAAGFAEMNTLIQGLRNHPPEEIAGYTVEKQIDYQQDNTGLPRSNVLRFFLTDGTETTIRPSGTEPKLKIYFTTVSPSRALSEERAEKLAGYFTKWVKQGK